MWVPLENKPSSLKHCYKNTYSPYANKKNPGYLSQAGTWVTLPKAYSFTLIYPIINSSLFLGPSCFGLILVNSQII